MPEVPPPVGERFLVLVNPRASGGHGDASSLRRRLAAAFVDHEVPFDFVQAESAEDAMAICRQAAEAGYRAVAAAGGDGTVAAAIRGTAGREVPVAILPFGTGNQLATNFGVPQSLEGSVRVAVEGRVEPIDLGWIRGQYFALISGAGMDAETMAEATQELKHRLGPLAYVYAGLKQAISPRTADFRIRVDEDEMEIRATMVLVANVGLVAAQPLPLEFKVGPKVSFQDGLLDVCIFGPRNLPEAARTLWKLARHDYEEDERMIFMQARTVRVESDPVLPVQVDGEPSGETPVEAEVRPSAGRILVPS